MLCTCKLCIPTIRNREGLLHRNTCTRCFCKIKLDHKKMCNVSDESELNAEIIIYLTPHLHLEPHSRYNNLWAFVQLSFVGSQKYCRSGTSWGLHENLSVSFPVPAVPPQYRAAHYPQLNRAAGTGACSRGIATGRTTEKIGRFYQIW